MNSPRKVMAVSVLLACILLAAETAVAQAWKPVGPGPTMLGQVEKIADFEVSGAVQAIAPHPNDPNILYAGAVNGGLWKTTSALGPRPQWQRLTDDAESLSIGALEFDPLDRSNATLIAGTGRFSSYSRFGGSLVGLLRTTDAGVSWQIIDGGGALKELQFTGVAPRGPVIVATANNAGVFRSPDSGASWTMISGDPATNLPAGGSFDLAGDRRDPELLFTNAGTRGIYRSTNTGATWTKVSNANMDALLASDVSNVKIAIGANDSVFVAIAVGGRLAGLFQSRDMGGQWTALDLPITIEGGNVNFGVHPGGQADIHFSLCADPHNANIVYIGGDRQPHLTEGIPGAKQRWPNSIGAVDYTGRVFRVDSSKTSGSQATPITHSLTASRSAPHADSRRLRFAANGDLVEADDGGIYRRTRPQDEKGDWFSVNGDIQTAELHSVAWDSNTHTIVAGAQDTGTPQQLQPANARWQSVSNSDGGVVAVDDFGSPGHSTRYSSYYEMGDFRRQVYDASGDLKSEVRPKLLPLGGASKLIPKFYTPIEVNRIAPSRIVFAGEYSLYESFDQGDSIREVGRNLVVNESGPIAYGAPGNPHALYVGVGSKVYARTSPYPAALAISDKYPGTGHIMGIAFDSDHPRTVFVIETADVYRTPDDGMSWARITGNLAALRPGPLLSIVYSSSPAHRGIIIGTTKGGVVMAGDADFSSWSRLGTGLPRTWVLSLRYSVKDGALVAGTLGRGAWMLDLR
jgi:photosystem II stability/assembly factor-like uncharacterized protein